MLKFILGFEDWRNKTKEIYYSPLFFKVISFVIQGLEPRMNFNKFLIYRNVLVYFCEYL